MVRLHYVMKLNGFTCINNISTMPLYVSSDIFKNFQPATFHGISEILGGGNFWQTKMPK